MHFSKLTNPWAARSRGKKSYGREAQPINCFQYVRDGVFPDKFVCGAGFMRLVATVLRENGYSVFIQDMTPHPNPSVYEPQWDRLSKITWKYKQKWLIERLLKVTYGCVVVPTGHAIKRAGDYHKHGWHQTSETTENLRTRMLQYNLF